MGCPRAEVALSGERCGGGPEVIHKAALYMTPGWTGALADSTET